MKTEVAERIKPLRNLVKEEGKREPIKTEEIM